jgi:hypothetical protein
VRLPFLPLSLGYVRIGCLFWSGDYGMDWGFGREPTRHGDRHYRYRHYGSIAFVSREAWIDCGWLAFWPVHFYRRTLGYYDSEVCDWENGMAHHHPFKPSWRWTGRRTLIDGVSLTLFGYRWYWSFYPRKD